MRISGMVARDAGAQVGTSVALHLSAQRAVAHAEQLRCPAQTEARQEQGAKLYTYFFAKMRVHLYLLSFRLIVFQQLF
jgi:hypothetical protein